MYKCNFFIAVIDLFLSYCMVDIDWFVKLAKVNINIDFNIDSSVTQIYIEEKLLYCNSSTIFALKSTPNAYLILGRRLLEDSQASSLK